MDTTAPAITCPAAVTVNSDFEVPAPASNYAEFVAQGGSASDNCTGTPTVTHVSDVPSGSNPKTITRTYQATDVCGNTATCTHIITVPETDAGGTLITDTMRCTLPNNQLRLIFTPDPQNMPCYKLTASNPGQFYFNLFYSGTPGEVETFKVTLPYPWVTQGARPVEVYDSVDEIPQEYRLVLALFQCVEQPQIGNLDERLPLRWRTCDGHFGCVPRGT